MIKALEERTREQAREITMLKAELAAARAKEHLVTNIMRRIESLEASINNEKRVSNK